MKGNAVKVYVKPRATANTQAIGGFNVNLSCIAFRKNLSSHPPHPQRRTTTTEKKGRISGTVKPSQKDTQKGEKMECKNGSCDTGYNQNREETPKNESADWKKYRELTIWIIEYETKKFKPT